MRARDNTRFIPVVRLLASNLVHVVAIPQVMIQVLTSITSQTHTLGASRINQMVHSNQPHAFQQNIPLHFARWDQNLSAYQSVGGEEQTPIFLNDPKLLRAVQVAATTKTYNKTTSQSITSATRCKTPMQMHQNHSKPSSYQWRIAPSHPPSSLEPNSASVNQFCEAVECVPFG